MLHNLDMVVISVGLMNGFAFDAVVVESRNGKAICISDDADLSVGEWHVMEGDHGQTG